MGILGDRGVPGEVGSERWCRSASDSRGAEEALGGETGDAAAFSRSGLSEVRLWFRGWEMWQQGMQMTTSDNRTAKLQHLINEVYSRINATAPDQQEIEKAMDDARMFGAGVLAVTAEDGARAIMAPVVWKNIPIDERPAELRPPPEHEDKPLHWVINHNGAETVAHWFNNEGDWLPPGCVIPVTGSVLAKRGYRYLGPAEWSGPAITTHDWDALEHAIVAMRANIAELEAERAEIFRRREPVPLDHKDYKIELGARAIKLLRDATRRSAIRIHARMKREARASGDQPSARHHDREMQAIATDIAAEHIVDGVPIRLPVDAEKVLAVIASVLN